MTEKILNVRLINKNDTYANLQASSFVPMKGEIILAEIMTQQTDAHNNLRSVPTYCMKVGDGSKTFAQLEWLHAPASDVYAWAKSANFPVKVEDEGNGVGSIAWTNNQLVITRTQFAVAADISSAITELETGAVQDAKDAADAAQEDATKALADAATADGKAVAAQEAADKAQDDIDAHKEAFETFKESNTTAINAAASAAKNEAVEAAATDATSKANTAKSEAIAAAATDATTKANAAQAAAEATAAADATSKADAALASAKTYAEEKANAVAATVTALDTRVGTAEGKITTLEGKVDALSSATHFLGVKDELPATGDNGDIVIVGNKEYIRDGEDWIELGDTTAELAAIDQLGKDIQAETSARVAKDTALEGAVEAAQTAADNAQDAADAAQADVDALETVVSNLTTTVGNNKTAAENAVAGERSAREAADTQIRTDFAAADATIRTDFAAADAVIDDKVVALTTRVGTAEDEIDAIQQTLESMATSETVTNLGNRMDQAESDIDSLETRATTLENAAASNLTVGAKKADNTYDLLNNGDLIIFNCGTASTNI